MNLEYFWRGLVIGLSIAAPVGPIGVLCLRRSLADGWRMGLATGLGAATADAAYGCVAGFGLTAISGFLVAQQFWLGLIGGLFLVYLGIRTFMAVPAERAAASRPGGAGSAFLSTLLLTLTNPMTILSFVAVFAGIGLGSTRDYASAALLVSGVFLGSAAWWLFLSATAARFRHQFSPAWLRSINRLSGGVIIAFGIWSLLRLR